MNDTTPSSVQVENDVGRQQFQDDEFPDIEGRLRDRVRIGSRCWEWTGEKTDKGYGAFRVLGKPKKVRVTRHIVSLMLGRDLAKSEYVCHRCDNPSCVRPSHLFVGTPRDNMKDMKNKGRHRVRKGSSHPKSRLTPSKVLWARAAVATGMTQQLVSEVLGVHYATVSKIVRGETWKHVKTCNDVALEGVA